MGLFVTIEGNDGSGKTTVVQCLNEKLTALNLPVITSREPGGIRISEAIRDLILNPALKEMSAATEALLYAASRSQHIDEKIRPALQEGNIVICDRFIDSSLAYQGYARGLGIQEVYQINLFAIKSCIPDVTIFLEIDPEVAKQRLQIRERLDRLELEGDEFQLKVKEGYQKIVDQFQNRIVRVDANRPLKVVVDEVLQIILEKYNANTN